MVLNSLNPCMVDSYEVLRFHYSLQYSFPHADRMVPGTHFCGVGKADYCNLGYLPVSRSGRHLPQL